jgi:hypothetical protein
MAASAMAKPSCAVVAERAAEALARVGFPVAVRCGDCVEVQAYESRAGVTLHGRDVAGLPLVS